MREIEKARDRGYLTFDLPDRVYDYSEWGGGEEYKRQDKFEQQY